MRWLDDTIYYTCCFVVILHSLSALLVITHGRCGVYAAAFLVACAMWVDLTALNLWFFLPTIVHEAPNIELNLGGTLWEDVSNLVQTVFLSTAATYLYMMLFGWFVGSMSLSNALSMWQGEGCDAMDSHCHTGISGRVIRLAHLAEAYVGIRDVGYLPFLEDEETQTRSAGSCLFIVPRWLHPCYVTILSPPIKLLGERNQTRVRGEKM
ncbi:hypothetical protein JX265_010793 [Neoarthrinium moseri]|uniref:Uncharacterized protein n=1 Tax=Neoarthrinium moseri TaxID=1658444 RepID=A0A9P9WDB8_9PEZI|nr:uncharacterized protein JN550_010641 [Neoarthrinium moseri]KAI1858125.1 hypothetical protein JX265_010793 [Neoarthrinium moseri]KAI1862010.1 hypothetical protein JN550_010641 [Neoarthrinium moseri]